MMATKKIPMRMCIGCREMKPKKDLVRVVKSPEGDIFLDRTGKANGRGAYVCDHPACMQKVRKNKALSHTFQTPVPESVYEALEAEWNHRGE